MPENKRRFTRIPLGMPTTLQLEDGTTYHFDSLENLSIGGCLLEVEARLPIGEACLLKISLGNDEGINIITVSGSIVRSEADMTGIKFDQIDPDSLFLLQNIIRYNAADPDLIEDEISKHPGIK